MAAHREEQSGLSALPALEDSMDLQPVLESPPAPDAPATFMGDLFPEDSIGLVNAKVVAIETMLGLITSDIKFADFMRDMLLAFMKAIKAEAGSILEADYDHQILFFRAVVGQSSDRIDQFKIPFGKGIVGHVFESRQPLVMNDPEENAIHLKAVQEAVGFETRNLIAVPIVIRGRVFAVLEMLNRVGEDCFTNGDVDLLVYLCGAAAKAIEARLMLGWALAEAKEAKNSQNGKDVA